MRKITTKLLIAIGTATFLLSIFLLYQSYKFTKRQVLKDAEQNASMALEFDVAIRDYIAQHVRPVMYKFLGKEDFMPETMSTSYVAREIFEDVRKGFPNYIIKFSSDNPRNPLNKAGAEELNIIDYFNKNPQSQKWEGKIAINGKPYFAKFSAMRMEKACLRCHGDPENAPASLVKRYGPTAGFHCSLGKVIGMDTIAVPMVTLSGQLWPELRQSFLLIALGLALFFLSIICVTRFIITRRLSSITEHFLAAAQQSNYQKLTPIEIKGSDEIQDLAFSYNTLCGKLKKFYSFLDAQVKDRTRQLADKNEQMKQEIEERKQAEKEIKSLARFPSENPNPVLRISRDGLLLYANAAAFSVLSEWELHVGQAVPKALQEFSKMTEKHPVRATEISFGDHSYSFNAAFIPEESYINLYATDISDLKLVEREVRESERFLKTLLNAIPIPVFYKDRNGRYLGVNRAFEKFFGETMEGLIGKTVFDINPPELAEIYHAKDNELLERGVAQQYESQVKNGQGAMRHVIINKAVFLDSQGSVGGLIGTFIDITENKQVEQDLRRSEENYRELVENLNDVIYLIDSDGTITYVSPPIESVLGYTLADLAGKYYGDIIHPDDLDAARQVFKDVLQDKIYPVVFRVRMKNGEYRWMRISSRPLYEGDQAKGLQGVITDIDEQKRAAEALHESERMLVATGKKGKIGGWEHDLTTRKAVWTKVLYDLIGIPYDREPPGPDEHLRYYPPEDRKIIEHAYCQAIEKGIPFDLELQVYTSKKKLLWCRVQGDPVIENDKCIKIRGIFQDITEAKQAEKERQKLETQLMQSQKMEAIGKLAGGIAHDFNNLLTTIIGNADFALDQAGENRSLYNDIEEIRNVGRQAAALTRQLLAFSRKQIIQPQILNFNEILENIGKIIRRTIGEDVEFKTTMEPDLWDVKMDPGQIEQILMNLVVNARDAMPHGGKLTVETANVELDDAHFQNHGVESRPGSYAMLAITDTGTGMDANIQTQIFEPFFTTKERGQGTGLGLSTVYGIVKQNNGHIWVYSEPGKGTTFKIYFLKIAEDEESDTDEQLDENRLIGSETIMVVEDNKKLLKLTKKMLESYGYKVLAAQNANEAMEAFNRQGGSIHLLLTDVVMPGTNGRKLAEEIQSKNPDIKLIYMSGYTDDTISKHGVLYDDVEFIEKPFSQKDLGLKVREVLDE